MQIRNLYRISRNFSESKIKRLILKIGYLILVSQNFNDFR